MNNSNSLFQFLIFFFIFSSSSFLNDFLNLKSTKTIIVVDAQPISTGKYRYIHCCTNMITINNNNNNNVELFYVFLSMNEIGSDHSCRFDNDNSILCVGNGYLRIPYPHTYISLSSRASNVCMLSKNGTVDCYNIRNSNITTLSKIDYIPTSKNENFIKISVGNGFICTINKQYIHQCWVTLFCATIYYYIINI